MLGRLLPTSGALLSALVLNAYRFRVWRETRALPGLQAPVRAAFLSDLHYGTAIGAGSVRRWVSAALAARPDVILIGGDFLDGGLISRPHGPLIAELARLRAPLGVYAVFGNHDWTALNTAAVRADFARQLEAVGVRLINNAGVQVRPDLFVAGVDDWWFGLQDCVAAFKDHTGGPVLLLSHNPDFLPHVPENVTLTLSGHTHGGQVRIPFLGPVKRASLYGTQFLEGWVQAAPVQPTAADESVARTPARVIHGYVSHGLGVTGLPARFLCPAELTLFEFVPEEGSGKEGVGSGNR